MANQQADAKVTTLTGKAYAERNGTRITLTEGADIYASDTIITDSSSGVEVVFRDNAVIKLGPGSQVAVQDFVYDGENNPSFAVQLVTGVMTSLSGEVVKQNPAAFKISTPRATIGIRGTETYHSVQGDTETHAVVHISQGHIVMLSSSDGQSITLGSAMQAVSLSENGKPLTIRTFQPNEMDKLQNALGGMTKKAPVQEGQPDQDGPQTPNTGDEGAQNTNAPQAAATSTVVQDEIRVLVVAESGTEATVAVVQDTLQTVQDTTGILIESPVISPIGAGSASSLAETVLADNPVTPPADFVPPSAGETPAPTPPAPTPPDPTPPDPTPPSTPGENITVSTLINDTLTATDGNDTITVDVMNTATINAGTGDDSITITQSQGPNTVNGGAGNDSLYISGGTGAVTISGVETVYGTGSNVILGNGGENVILHGVSSVTGSSGNDTITIADATSLTSVAGGAGNDSITIGNGAGFSAQGGDGNDIITVGAVSNVTIDGGTGDDSITITQSQGPNTVNGGAGNDSLYISGGTGAVTISGVETVYGTGNNVILGNAGENVILHGVSSVTGSSGNDTITIADATSLTSVAGGAGDDSITIGNGAGFSAQGGDGNDIITVGAVSNVTIDGGTGDDSITITQSQGPNTVNGGAGNDSLYISGGSGAVTISGVETVYGTGSNVILGNAGENVILHGVSSVTGSSGNDTITIADATSLTSVAGGAGDDSITIGNGAGFSVQGGDGNDTITVGAISNVTIDGGIGDDSITITQSQGPNTVNGGAGNDSLYISGGSGAVTISGVETVYGTGSTVVLGNAGENVTLHGVGSVTGGSGNDTITVADATSLTSVAGGAGNDVITVQNAANPSIPLTIDGGAGNDSITIDSVAGNDFSVQGGDGNDTITVGTLSNATINGGAGDDSITITQSVGANIINGGAGNDSLYIGSGATGGAAGAITISGIEHVYGDNTFITLGNAGENVTLHGVNTITGGSGNDTITVADATYLTTVTGGAGNDVITVQNAANPSAPLIIDGGAGNDSITIDSVAGNDFSVQSGDGNDTITVGTLSNATIDGGAGDDSITITQSLDANIINGGAGNDSLYISGGTGAVTISGVETVYGTGSTVTLGTAGENVTLHGVSSVTGSSGNDTITIADTAYLTTVTGGAGNDVINITNTSAAGGGFTVTGGDGSDAIHISGSPFSGTVYGGGGGDTITIDTLKATAGTLIDADPAGISDFDSATGQGRDHIIITHIAAGDTGAAATVKGGHGDDIFTLGTWDNGTSIKLDMSRSAGNADKLEFGKGATEAGGGGRVVTGGGYEVDFVQDGKTLTVIFDGINNRSEYEALRGNISGLGPSL